MCDCCKRLGFNNDDSTNHYLHKEYLQYATDANTPYIPFIFTNEHNETCAVIIRNKHLIDNTIDMSDSQQSQWDLELPNQFSYDESCRLIDLNSFPEGDRIEKFGIFINAPKEDIDYSHVGNYIDRVYSCDVCGKYHLSPTNICVSCTISCMECNDSISCLEFCTTCNNYNCTYTGHDNDKLCNNCKPTCDDCEYVLTQLECEFCQHCMIYDCQIDHDEPIHLCTNCTFPYEYEEITNGIDEYIYTMMDIDNILYVYVQSDENIMHIRRLIDQGILFNNHDGPMYLYTYDGRWHRLSAKLPKLVRGVSRCGR